jgi:hypothetical protein
MSDDFSALSLLAMAELSQLRSQAFDIFDRCLADNNPAPIVAFIERQLTSDPPHLTLLRDFNDGLHQRLLTLRVNYYDVRRNVVKTFTEDYGIDITPLVPANDLAHYHELDLDKVMALANEKGLSEKDLMLLHGLLSASVKTSAQLNQDIQMITDLQKMITDWLDALSAHVSRRFWSESDSKQSPKVH